MFCIIRYFKRRKYIKKIINTDNCAICLGKFSKMKKKDLGRVKCNHIFCRKCIIMALQFNSCCPLCKTNLNIIVDGKETSNACLYSI